MNCGGKKKGYRLGGSVCSKCGGKAGCSCNAQKFSYGGSVMPNKKRK